MAFSNDQMAENHPGGIEMFRFGTLMETPSPSLGTV